MDAAGLKKAQAVWACWRLVSRHNTTDPRSAAQAPFEVPSSFATRCRKLIELGVGAAELPGRQGADTLFGPYEVWELAIGLALSDLGLNQQHVAFVLRNIRPYLRDTHTMILENLPVVRSALLASDRPGTPVRAVNPEFADTDVFLVLRPAEIKEAHNTIEFDATDWDGAAERHPLIFFNPDKDIVRGSDALGARMTMRDQHSPKGRSHGERGWIVFEVADMAAELEGLRPQVPELKRGPKARPSN